MSGMGVRHCVRGDAGWNEGGFQLLWGEGVIWILVLKSWVVCFVLLPEGENDGGSVSQPTWIFTILTPEERLLPVYLLDA
jgi:hypothetical protein